MGIIRSGASESGHYFTEAFKRTVHMHELTDELNKRHQEGWGLHTLIDQGDKLLLVFERRA